MTTRLTMVLAALLAILAVLPVQGRSQDESIDELLGEFRSLHASLQANNGVRDENVPLIRSFRDRVNALSATAPGDERLLALDVQLSLWLKENDRVDQGYEKLIEAADDSENLSDYALAWIAFVRRNGEPFRVAEVYEDLIERMPDDVGLRLDWAGHLRLNGEFAKSLEVIESTEFDPAEHPQALVTLCETQMAEHRFDEALATLDRMPAEVLEADRAMSSRVDVRRTQAQGLIDDWATEDEIRAAEAEADDLPRAEFITSRGDIVVELFENEAPNTVANFITLAEMEFWYSTLFYNVRKGTYVLGGDPIARPGLESDLGKPGGSNPGWNIPDEHTRDDFRKHFSGSLGMSRGPGENSGGCLFYFAVRPMPERNSRYTVFGRVIEGMDVLRSLEKDDVLVNVRITRQRDHPYEVTKLPTKATPLPKNVPSAGPKTAPEAAPPG